MEPSVSPQEPQFGESGARRARDVLDAAERAAQRARADTRELPVFLTVFGVLILVFGGLVWLTEQPYAVDYGQRSDGSFWSSLQTVRQLYWLLAGPLGLLVVAAWSNRHANRLGAGRGGRAWATTAFVLAAALLLVFPLLVLFPMVGVGVALLGVSWQRRKRALAGWAVVVGGIGGLAGIGFFDNRTWDLLSRLGVREMPGWLVPSGVVLVLLGASLLVGASRTLRPELP